MPTTPVYGWPYLNEATDPLTYTAVSGEDYLLDIEATVSGVDTRLAAVEAVATELGDAWTTYAPSWTVLSGTNPTAASHDVTGRWRKFDSRLAIVQGGVIGLTTTGWGSGTYQFGLPFTITSMSVRLSVGSGALLDSGTQQYSMTVKPNSTTTVRCYMDQGFLISNSPVVLTTNDEIAWSLLVEPA